MAIKPPVIDSRSAADIARQVKDLLAIYAPEWKEFDPITGKPQGMSAALINIFARYCEIIIQRLNKTPEKNFLAFLDLLGASLQPPQPARVPLTFTLAAGRTDAAVVRKGTQAAAPPVEGEKDPVIFETERELTVTPARFVAVFTRDPATDRYGDRSAVIAAPSASGVPVFEGDRPIEHILYLAQDQLLGLPNIKKLTLSFTLSSSVEWADTRHLLWEFWDGNAWMDRKPLTDSTQTLTLDGIVQFGPHGLSPLSKVHERHSRWLRCRMLTPITLAEEETEGLVRRTHIPAISKIDVGVELAREGLVAQNAFFNSFPLDESKEFFPFGEKPRFGDAFYLAHDEAFAQAGTTVTLDIGLVNPAGGTGAPVPAVVAFDNLEIKWEYWNGTAWIALGIGAAQRNEEAEAKASYPDFEDTTQAFTKTGKVILKMPGTPEKRAVNGVENYWVRARITLGNYGKEAYYTLKDPNTPADGYVLNAATFAPPMVASVNIDYSVEVGPRPPDAVIRYNDFIYEDVTFATAGESRPFSPFTATRDQRPTIYYGFDLPPGLTAFPNRTVSLFNRLMVHKYGEEPAPALPAGASAAEQPEVAWEYWNGAEWWRLAVRDESENFKFPGAVEFLPPSDFSTRSEFGVKAFWLRARWERGAYALLPRLNRTLLNTTMAIQCMTIVNETLGSSDQSEGQKLRTVRAPVLSGQQLLVREPEMPSKVEQESIKEVEGENAITLVPDATGRAKEIWVRWHEVADFYASGPRSRHFVVDHLTGDITFGDGLSGMIPPRGVGNIRMAQYRTGGGSRGNRPAGVIAQLKTTIPYVEKVTNTELSIGGADAETKDSLYERAPRTIRHRDRAVSGEDYEDLAKLASPDVVRALCVPLRNLEDERLGYSERLGQVSVIIVPRSTAVKPLPDLELMTRVRNYISSRSARTANVSVVGALFVRVSVTVDIALVSLEGASGVEQAVRAALDGFLHPLTGGTNNTGWDFGRNPYQSDFYALIEAVPGVDHIRSLALTEEEEPDGAKGTGRFLVYSGHHRISMVFEG